MTEGSTRGLMNFFKINKDNVRGIFDTCIDRLFNDHDMSKVSTMISKNPAINVYWLNPSIFYYIQTMELVFSNGRWARSTF